MGQNLRYLYAHRSLCVPAAQPSHYGSYYQLILQSHGDMVFHIEHIISNNKKNLALFKSEDEFNTERNRLGALVLLKGSDNEASGDELYKEKQKTYSVKGTRFAQTLLKDFYQSNPDFKKNIKKYNLKFVPCPIFRKDEIEARHKLLFEIIKHIWQLKYIKRQLEMLMDILLILESRKIEFKETFPPCNKIDRTAIAFSNDAGGEIYNGENNKLYLFSSSIH